jgi:hypothetical protein
MHPPWLAPDVAQELEVQLVVPLLERVADGRLQEGRKHAVGGKLDGRAEEAMHAGTYMDEEMKPDPAAN